MKDKKNTNKNWFSKQSKAVKIIITIFGVCCIGLIVLNILGSMLPDSMIPGNFSESKLYENEYLSFEYPQSLVDISFFNFLNDKYYGNNYVFVLNFGDPEQERNAMTVSASKIDEPITPEFMDEYYEDVKVYYEDVKVYEKRGMKNFTLEKIDFNGIPAIKSTEEYYETAKYAIHLFLVYNDKLYVFYFDSDNFNNVEHMYDLLESSLVLK